MDVEGPAAEIFIVAQVGKRQCPHTKAEAEAIRCVGRWGRLERRRLLRNHFKDGILRRNLRECLQPRTSRNTWIRRENPHHEKIQRRGFLDSNHRGSANIGFEVQLDSSTARLWRRYSCSSRIVRSQFEATATLSTTRNGYERPVNTGPQPPVLDSFH